MTDESAEYTVAQRWIILVAVMLGTILQVLDTSIVNVAIPQMMGNLGASISEIGWVSTSYIISNVIFLAMSGWLSAFFGRRRYLTYSIILFTASSFMCGTAHSLNALVAYRVLQGIGGAALLSTAQAVLMEIFPRSQLGPVQAIYTIGVVVAPTVGPTVGGWITDNYNWPWIFFVNVPIGTVAAILVWNFLRDSRYEVTDKKRIDILGIGLLAIGLGSLQTVLEKGNEEGWFQSNLIIGFGLAAFFALLIFVWWELTTPSPVVNLRVLRNRGYTAGIVFATVLGFGLYGGVFILPIFLQEIRGFTPTETGFLLFPGGLATMLTLPILGKIVGKVSPVPLVALGAVTLIVSMLMLSSLTNQTGAEQVYLALIVRGASLGCLFLPLTLATLTGLRPDEMAGGTGLFNLARQLGGSTGIAFLTTLLAHDVTLHRAALANNITNYNPWWGQRQLLFGELFQLHGSVGQVQYQQSLQAMNYIVARESAVLAYCDGFRSIAIAFLVALPLVFLFQRGKAAIAHPAPAMD